MRYELWKAGNKQFSEHDRLSVAEGAHGTLVAGYVYRHGPNDWRIEDDIIERKFLTAEDAADALTSE